MTMKTFIIGSCDIEKGTETYTSEDVGPVDGDMILGLEFEL